MYKTIAGIVFLLISGTSFAKTTVRDLAEVYGKILKANPQIKRVRLEVSDEPFINAYNVNGGERVVITKKMLQWLPNKSSLALVLAHELGHNLSVSESDADAFGARYIQRAGYNVCYAAQIFKTDIFKDGDPPIHPPGMQRYHDIGCFG